MLPAAGPIPYSGGADPRPIQHTVNQGEQISSIAERYGFSSYRTLRDHPDNAERATLVMGELDLRIGHLDPVDATTGLQARLNNLGYSTGELPGGQANRPLNGHEASGRDGL